MTIQEFRDNITSLSEMIDFCKDNYIEGYTEDLIYCEDLGENIDEDIRDRISWDSWQSVRDFLHDIDEDYYWYRKDGNLDYVGLDEDDYVEELKDKIIYDVSVDFWDADEDAIEEIEEDYDIEEEDEEPEFEFDADIFMSSAAEESSVVIDEYALECERRYEEHREFVELLRKQEEEAKRFRQEAERADELEFAKFANTMII